MILLHKIIPFFFVPRLVTHIYLFSLNLFLKAENVPKLCSLKRYNYVPYFCRESLSYANFIAFFL